MDELERCILVKQEVFVYKIPPRQSARGYRAADWNLSSPDWTGRMRVMQQTKSVTLKLEDKGNGELFAACPIDTYPGPAVEPVSDSSRYFVIRITDSGRSAFIGIGFSDRSDSFDLNVALQDHFKGVKKEDEILKEDLSDKPQLDLAFKEGQTIKVNINIPKSDKTKTRNKQSSTGMLLPPPPANMGKCPSTSTTDNNNKVPGTSNLTPLTSPVGANPLIGSSNVDLLCDLGDLSLGTTTTSNVVHATSTAPKTDDPWGDFASADSNSKSSGNWVQF